VRIVERFPKPVEVYQDSFSSTRRIPIQALFGHDGCLLYILNIDTVSWETLDIAS
jgi:hypothetical protein